MATQVDRLTINEMNVVVKVTTRSKSIVANILGREDTGNGQEMIYLDRLVHSIGQDEIAGIRCFGAVSTILETSSTIAENSQIAAR